MNWLNFWDGKSNTTELTHELLDAQDLRLVSNFYLIRAPWTRPFGHILLKLYKNIAGKQNDMFGIQIFICYENAHLGQSKYSDGKLRTVVHQLGL